MAELLAEKKAVTKAEMKVVLLVEHWVEHSVVEMAAMSVVEMVGR